MPASPSPRPRDARSQRYLAVRAATRALAAPLSAEDCALQSMPDASPAKWHLAHTTWFFETFLLAPHASGYRVFDPTYGFLYNSYYEAIGARHPRPERGLLSRPALDEILAYRQHVDEAMLSLQEREDLFPLIELGLHHEQQHQELVLTDLKHLLSRNPLRPAYEKPWPLAAIEPRLAAEGPEHDTRGKLVSPGLVDTPGVAVHGLINEQTKDRVQPIEYIAEAVYRLASGDPKTMTGRIDYAEPFLKELGITPSELA